MGMFRTVAALALVACGRPAITVDPLFIRPGDVLCGAGCSDDTCRFSCPSGLDCFANGLGVQARNVCLTAEVACARIGCPSANECAVLLETRPSTIGCVVDR